MTLREWFNESPTHLQAIGWGKNGKKYIYHRNTKSKLLDKWFVSEEVELEDVRGQGAWLEQ